jgi:hypothetical protein
MNVQIQSAAPPVGLAIVRFTLLPEELTIDADSLQVVKLCSAPPAPTQIPIFFKKK